MSIHEFNILFTAKLFGRCCGGKPESCGGYAMGKSAMEHYREGLFQNASETTWVR